MTVAFLVATAALEQGRRVAMFLTERRLPRTVAAGHPGRTSGRGLYDHANPDQEDPRR